MNQLPALTLEQANKLKQLTIISLAVKNKTIPYATLMACLDFADVRQLEDIIIDSINKGSFFFLPSLVAQKNGLVPSIVNVLAYCVCGLAQNC
jgi:hypothetical protein